MKNHFKYLINITILLCSAYSTYAQDKSLNLETSNIRWYGEEITGKQHYGDLKFSSGNIQIKNEVVTNGSFIVNMNSLTVEDLSGGGKKRLEGHLRSTAFFGVSDHPQASLSISSMVEIDGNSQILDGQLTIKGVTHPINFSLTLTPENNASAILVFDRSKYDVRFRSGSFFDELGDKLILDEIKLEVALDFN
jgi:polyisoprenoid-binding protein YceI